MDNLTHSLAGLVLSRAGLGRTTAGATAALVIGSNLPDLDIVARVFGTVSYLEHHRGMSHSVLAAPLIALGLALVLRLAVKGSHFGWLALCSLVGVAGHTFMDLWTSYGTRALLPLDQTWYAWDIVYIIDPLLWVLLLASVLLFRRSEMSPQIATVGLGLLLTYVGARAAIHGHVIDQAKDRIGAPSLRQLAALPSPLSPFKWKILADDGKTFYSGEVDVRSSWPRLLRREKLPEDRDVQKVRETSDVAAIFLDFSRFPWLEVEGAEGGRAVSWRDLRFEDVPGLVNAEAATQMRRRRGFTARVVLGPDGRIVSESIRF
jgi:inner membrane protein